MKKVMLNLFAVALTVLGLGAVATVSPAYAADNVVNPNGGGTGGGTGGGNDQNWKDCVGKTDCITGTSETGVFGKNDLMGTLTIIINVVVSVVGFISVAMIVMGGISFATSQGDTAKTTKARNTILYGVVGLVVAILAFAIVNFVLANVFGS